MGNGDLLDDRGSGTTLDDPDVLGGWAMRTLVTFVGLVLLLGCGKKVEERKDVTVAATQPAQRCWQILCDNSVTGKCWQCQDFSGEVYTMHDPALAKPSEGERCKGTMLGGQCVPNCGTINTSNMTLPPCPSEGKKFPIAKCAPGWDPALDCIDPKTGKETHPLSVAPAPKDVRKQDLPLAEWIEAHCTVTPTSVTEPLRIRCSEGKR